MQITNAFRHPVVYFMPVSAAYRMDGQFILCVVLGPPFISSLDAREQHQQVGIALLFCIRVSPGPRVKTSQLPGNPLARYLFGIASFS